MRLYSSEFYLAPMYKKLRNYSIQCTSDNALPLQAADFTAAPAGDPPAAGGAGGCQPREHGEGVGNASGGAKAPLETQFPLLASY